MCDLQSVLLELKGRIINSAGVKICIEANKANFENWVQVELCSLLKAIPDLKVVVEKPYRVPGRRESIYVDVFTEDNQMNQQDIQIKVVKYGPEGGINEEAQFVQDIEKLQICESRAQEKYLLSVVYHKGELNWLDYELPDGTGHAQNPEIFTLMYAPGEQPARFWLDLIKISHV
jgi:hypothetical protein